jgi:2,3-bisphosphoglycerate-dependent phosphoglycerate mutase
VTTTFILIRHGEAQSALDGRIGGHRECRGLSARGVEQAEHLAARLRRTGELDDADVLYTSVLRRAIETAELIQPVLNLAAKRDCSLCEMHDGEELDGMAVDDVRDRFWIPAHTAGYRQPWSALSPGTESWVECVARVGAALHDLAREHAGQKVVIVAHAGPIRAAFVALGLLPIQPPMGLYVANTSITEWRSEPEQSQWSWGLHRYNDHAHL